MNYLLKFKRRVRNSKFLFKIFFPIWRKISPYTFDAIFLSRYLEKVLPREEITFIQVGSNDGISNDPLRKYILEFNWNGILIEPNPLFYNSLKGLYRNNPLIKVLNLALSSEFDSSNGKKVFFVISDKAKKEIPTYRESYSQVASFSRDHIVKHYDGILEPYIQEIAVSCSTLNKIIEDKNLKKIDLIHIDAEGYDLEILKGFNLKKYLPNIIIFEHLHLDKSSKIDYIKTLKLNKYKVKVFRNDIVAFLKK